MTYQHRLQIGLAALAVALSVTAGMTANAQAQAQAQDADVRWMDALRDPPQSARPRVWWHWMNGNITEEGIAKDLDWMERVGIGGLQNFDASLSTPQIVEKRLIYMTPEWKKAFRFAAQRADEKGLEFAIAASPGWSETGGPWVTPMDAMKKLSWSHIAVKGGQRFRGHVPMPPESIGPFQDLGSQNHLGLEQADKQVDHAYGDIAVLAVPIRAPDGQGAGTGRFQAVAGDGRVLDSAMLADGDLRAAIDLGKGVGAATPLIGLTAAQPQWVRSATLFMPEGKSSLGSVRFSPYLEAELDGKWQKIADIPISDVPTTISFAPVQARIFRVVFGGYNGPKRPSYNAPAPGADIPAILQANPGPFTAKVAELRLSAEPVVDRFEAKAAFSLVPDYYALATDAAGDEQGADVRQVIDLTSRMQPDGHLDWTAPKGDWRIIRLGWTLTGKMNNPAPPEATGFEVDKMDGAAVERYLRHYLDMYRDAAGPELLGKRGIRALLTDSSEVGAFNWTPKLVDHFKRLRGYDPMPWLPTLTGVLIGSRKDSDRFLYDFRRTLADLHASEHYATVARIAKEYGLTLYGEALEDQRPVIGDDMAMRRHTDIPMAALWVWDEKQGIRETLLGDMKGASSVGHFYGKNIVAAESMTSMVGPWAAAPADLRRVIDLEFAHGINRPVIHTSVHQPLDDKKPGLTLMVFGQFFNRHESWAELARPWVDYMARASFLLQQGRNSADVAYFYGEEAPITALTAYAPLSDSPSRYAYDFVNSDGLMDGLRVGDDGRLVAPSGAQYRALYLGGSSHRMTLPALQRLAALAHDGATIIGAPPTASPSLADDDQLFAQLVKQLWSGASDTRIGKGRVIASQDVEAALMSAKLLPDFDAGDATIQRQLMFVHRSLPEGELYFIVNRGGDDVQLDARFRVTGSAPEWINAVDASVVPVSYRQDGELTHVPLAIKARESVFILFRRGRVPSERSIAAPAWKSAAFLDGAWSVEFEAGRGAPEKMQFSQLGDWAQNDDAGVKYFSGEAVYRKSFRLPKGVRAGQPLWLDLGQVGDVAEVQVNGQKLAGLWQAPYRVNIGAAVRAGDNQLTVKVANLWVNRLIGDAQPDAKKISFATMPTYLPDAPLRPSGLIGPVQLLVSE